MKSLKLEDSVLDTAALETISIRKLLAQAKVNPSINKSESLEVEE